jgi:glycosyltransferase involved in cell wall biosynthesis
MPAPHSLVTVAIPAYNHERYVVRALDSLLDSGVPELEILICDDASSDGTAAAAAAWGREHQHRVTHFQLLRHTRNAGLCATLNELVSSARGELIHLLASDDYLLPGGLLAKTQTLAAAPQWEGIFCDGCAVGLEDEAYAPSVTAASRFVPLQLTTEGLLTECLYHWGPPAHQMTWRRTFFKSHGGRFAYDPTVFCEDLDAALTAASPGKLGYLPQVCQAYRCRSWPQTSDRGSVRECRDLSFILAKHASRVPTALGPAFDLLSRAYMAEALGDSATAAFLREQHEASRQAYLAALANPGDAPVLPTPVPPGALLESQLLRLLAAEEELKTALRKARQATSEQKDHLNFLTNQLGVARHLLRYHSANPGRALRLWWQRHKLLP